MIKAVCASGCTSLPPNNNNNIKLAIAIIRPKLIEYVLCAESHSKCFAGINSFTPQSSTHDACILFNLHVKYCKTESQRGS